MRKLFFVLLAATMIVIGVSAGMLYRKTRPQVRVTTVEVEKDIRSHLSTGSSRAEVVAFLDSRRIGHSYINEDNLGYNNSEIALIRNAATRWPFRTDIQICFHFDKQMKLASYSVQGVSTGP